LGLGARGALVACAFGLALLAWGVADQRILERYRDQRQEHAITDAEFQSVSEDATRRELLARFGEPEDLQTLDAGGSGCITYKEEGAPLLRERTYRFCFEGGPLILKDFAPILDPDKLGEGDVLEGG
jgi:hypothetical protein